MAEAVTGYIRSISDAIVIDCRGDSSAVISVQGNFTGTLEVVGAVTQSSFPGGRLLFKSGVGSLGTNKIVNIGDIAAEYRCVAGGERLIIRPTAFTSGSVKIDVITTDDPSTIFINGPVHDAEEEAIRAMRGFAASTGPQPIASGNVMVVTLKNPADSGRNVFLRRRLFDNDVPATGSNLEYLAYASPTYEPTTTRNGVNLNGGTPFSDAQFKFEVRSIAGLTVGGSLGTGEILPRGAPYKRTLDFVLRPGFGVGFVIQGQGNNIAQAVRFSTTLEWYEELAN